MFARELSISSACSSICLCLIHCIIPHHPPTVLVGGPVELHYDYDIGEDFAVIDLRFYCKVAKGTHPRYQWFLNKTALEGRGSFYWVVDQPPEQSTLLLSVGRSSAGTYHCEVSDSFDNTSVIRSRKHYIDKEGTEGLFRMSSISMSTYQNFSPSLCKCL